MRESAAPCPRCDVPSPCVHFDTVHNGVGLVTFDHIYECQTHGEWAYLTRDFICSEHEDCLEHIELAKACEAAKPTAVFRDDRPLFEEPSCPGL